jgi:hypothetical protein
MSFLTRGEILAQPLYEARLKAQRYQKKTASTRHSIFLSHSHKDADLIDQFIAKILGDQADSVYIDRADETLPEKCTPITAAKVKGKIRECDKLLLLATNNACNSRWCPWELGVGDEANGYGSVVVVPVADTAGGGWQGNEYIGIYQYLDKDNLGRLYVVSPATQTKEPLDIWLKRPKTAPSGPHHIPSSSGLWTK